MNKNIAILTVSIMLIALFFQMFSWYMQAVQFWEKTDDTRRTLQMIHDYEAIRRKRSLNLDIDRFAFKANFDVKVKDFDLIINTSTKDESDDALLSSISEYRPGKYTLAATPDGKDVLEAIEKQLDDVLKKNRENESVIDVEVIGSADALPYLKKVYYDGLLGDTLSDVRYFKYGEPDTPRYITFIKGQTLMTNEYLALLRAWDAMIYLNSMYFIDPENIKIFVREFDKIGPEYRRLDLKITLKDAFHKDFDELNFIERLFGKTLK
jgi:hypothetical protein